MKRAIITLALLLGGVPHANADQDTYRDVRKNRPYDTLQQDTDYCLRTAGPNLNGKPTPPKFKRCMAGRGWRYAGTKREQLYEDPDNPGLVCHDFVIGGITGSSCSNF